MASRRLPLLLLVGAGALVELAGGCGGTASAPTISGISPSPVNHLAAVTSAHFTIIGSGFDRRFTPNANDPASSPESGGWQVIIGGKAMTTTWVSTTTLIATLPTSLSIGAYVVVATNPAVGTATLAPGLDVAGPAKLVIGSAFEPAPGVVNQVTLPLSVEDPFGLPYGLDSAFSSAVTLSSPAATADPISLAAGTSSGSIVVSDVHTGRVDVRLAFVPPSLALTTGWADFIAGPPFQVKALDSSGTVSVATGTGNTHLVLWDAWQNAVANTGLSLSITLGFGIGGTSCGVNPTFNPSSVSIAAGETTSGHFTVTCAAAGAGTTVQVVPNPPGGLQSSAGTMTYQ